MDKAIAEKVRQCKKLKGKSIFDLLKTRQFQKNMSAYLIQQQEERVAAEKSFKGMKNTAPDAMQGLKLPAHVIDAFMGMNAEQFTREFAMVLGKVSKRNTTERNYIRQLGMQAYNLTVAQIVCKEFPELESELLPKAKAN